MTNISKTILFFGTDSFSASALQALIDNGYRIGAVITKPDSRQGRGQQLSAPIVKTIAEKNGIPVWQPLRITDITHDIKALGPVAGVLSSYGKIIPQSIIDLFDPGIINIHPSLLPKYRGPSPIESAIINGDTETGVTIMQLETGMDSGPIYAQEIYPLSGSETQPELYDALSRFGTELLIKTLPNILSGGIRPLVQVGEAVYCHLLRKEDAFVDISQLTAMGAERRIRAYLAFPKTKLVLNNQTVTITKAHVSPERTSLLDVTCKDGQFLVIDQLIGPSGRAMSGKDFLNGYAAG